MTKVISVRFRTAGKVYFFDPGELEIKKGMNVIVETARGVEYGQVVGEMKELEDEDVVQPLKPVIRIATEEDDKREAENLAKKDDAFKICQEKILKHGLEMKLVDVEYTFDNNKILFYFTADGRIDFRELVKDLAAIFKTRIELRQIGVRDEIKILGGIGVCGRVLCCHSYLSEFVPVSIKMAKEQNLSLNPTKISGVCGRLMCCLKNEEETYEDLNKKLPGVGDYVTTDDGLRGEVHSVNVLRQLVKVLVDTGDEKEIKEYPADRLQFKKMFHKDKSDLTPEEMRQLELLEEQEQEDKLLKEERRAEKESVAASSDDMGDAGNGGRRDRGDRPRFARAERRNRNEEGREGGFENKDNHFKNNDGSGRNFRGQGRFGHGKPEKQAERTNFEKPRENHDNLARKGRNKNRNRRKGNGGE